MELHLKSGKFIRLDYLNGHSEKYLLDLAPDQQTKNVVYKVRKLQQRVNDEWKIVENFQFFSPTDMMELRTLIHNMDPEFNSYSELEHPTTGEVFNFPIVGSESFFYPTEI